MKNIFKTIIITAACGAAAISLTANAAAPAMPPTIVSVATATSQLWKPTVNAIGTLYADEGTTISAEADGRVTKIYAESGQIIKKGDPIIQIFPDVLEATLAQQQAQLQSDSQSLSRAKRLIKIGAVSQETYDTDLSKVKQDRANIKSTNAQLTQHFIRAPFTGKVGLIDINLGEYLRAGDQLIDLQQISPLYVDFSVSGAELANTQVNRDVKITTSAYPGVTFAGKVYATAAQIDNGTRMLKIRASMTNNKHVLMPGGLVNVTMSLGKPRNVVVIPQTSLAYSAAGPYVYTLSPKGTAVKTNVVLGQRLLANQVIVTKGVKAGTQLVNGGQMKLTNGAPAMTVEQAREFFIKKMQAGKEKK